MKNIHKHQTQNFQRISPFGITPLKKNTHTHIRLGHAGIVDHSVDLLIPDFEKSIKNMDRSIKKFEKYYINA